MSNVSRVFREWAAPLLCFRTSDSVMENIFEGLTEVKKYLTPWFWNKYVTTAYEAIQYESINQPFRCVGSRTKGNSYVMAFKTGEKITIEYLNSFLPEELRLDCVYKSKYTLDQARELYPEWYKRRIEQGKDRGHFDRYQPIYYNWIEKSLRERLLERGIIVWRISAAWRYSAI